MLRKPALIKVVVLGPEGYRSDLRFHPHSPVGLVKRAISLQLAVHPSRIALTRENVELNSSSTLQQAGILDGDFLKVIPRRQGTAPIDWDGKVSDPFGRDIVSEATLLETRWFHRENARDSVIRKNRIRRFLDKRTLPDNQLVAMAFNDGFSLLFANWAESVRRHRIEIADRCLVFPMDDQSERLARELGFFTCYDPDSRILGGTGTSRAFGDRQFLRHIYFQTAVVRDLLDFRVNVLFQDVDLVWLENPLPLLMHGAPDVEFMHDGATRRHGPWCANTGFMYFRDRPATRRFWNIVFSQSEQMLQQRGQQVVVNKILGVVGRAGLDAGILDEEAFVNGHRVGLDRTSSKIPAGPCVIHFSWTRNLQQKYDKYRSNGYWYLDRDPGDEYRLESRDANQT